jgi:hypothetical protein
MKTLVASLLVCAAGAASAGTVDVQLINPARFSDAGNAVWEEQDNAQALARHLQALGQKWLPADHQLKVELLDVDLAGTVRHGGREPVRVARGGADFPRLHLRYTLQAPGQPTVSGEEHLADLDYTRRPGQRGASEVLFYEKRMLEAWFRQRFAASAG